MSSHRAAHIRPRLFDVGPDDAIFYVIVDKPHCLHEGIDGGRTHEFPAAFARLLRQCLEAGEVERLCRGVWSGAGSNRHRKAANELSASAISQARAALLMTASIFPR
jgi:hypothetical protein